MANHALPTTSSLYTDVLTNLKDRIDDSLKMLDSVNTSPTNVPTNAVRWNSTTKLWEKYNGSAWGSLAASYAIQVLKSSNLVGGNSTTLLGSIPYQSNTDTTTLLAPNTTTTRKFLRQTGSGTNGSAPVWDTILASDVPTLNQSTTGNAATATTANTLNSSNSYTGVGFTANTGAFRAQNWGGVPTNGVTYYGNANSYIYKSGSNWEIKNEQSGFTNNLNTDGAIVTANGGTWGIGITGSSASCTGNSATATNADKLDNYHLDALGIPLFRGFNANGLHVTIDNLNTIAINSIYNCSYSAIGIPIAQWGFVHTMVHIFTTNCRTQMWYPMQNNSGTVYQRFTSDGVNWSAWASIGGNVDALKDVAANAQSTSYTLSLTDRGKSIDTTAGVTVPLNTSVAFPIGATVTITNLAATAITLTQTAGVTLRQAGTANTGNRTLAAYGMATLRKVATDTWFISGAGLS